MKKLDVLLVAFLFSVSCAVVSSSAPKTKTPMVQASVMEPNSPFGIQMGSTFKDSIGLIKLAWPNTYCDTTNEVRHCFNQFDFEGIPLTVDWRFVDNVLMTVICVTDAPNFSQVFVALNKWYGSSSAHRELENRNLYRWDKENGLVIGLDSAVPDEGDTFVIFFFRLDLPDPKRDPGIVDF